MRWFLDPRTSAFSVEVDTGSPQKMRPDQKARALIRFHRIEKRSGASVKTERGATDPRPAAPTVSPRLPVLFCNEPYLWNLTQTASIMIKIQRKQPVGLCIKSIETDGWILAGYSSIDRP